ncbi:MAG TPA: PA2778 family cysteine peptidase [Burkholderiales bacterium]|jgi:tetratricopeptide (TPR) repeat protein|nr:PA2778 family cysteine peptidase [Burkholderiales bacterium]
MRVCAFDARFPPLSGVFFVFALLASCTAPQTRALRSAAPPLLPSAVELDQSPFFPQEEFQCGPAALATTLNTAGIGATPEELARQVFLPARRGSLQLEMLAAARRHDAIAVMLPPRLDALLAEVANGIPVIVLQNLALDWVPMWHYAVVVGYDRADDEIILRSGRTKRQVMAMPAFERTWKRSRYWAMVTVPPGTIPATVAESDYVHAAVAFEKVASAAAARHAYFAATEKWPHNQLALLGLGNTAFSLQDWQAAETAFTKLVDMSSDPVPALNNLALTLDAQGRLAQAIEVARRAVSIGGPFAAQSRNTLATLVEKARDADNRNR